MHRPWRRAPARCAACTCGPAPAPFARSARAGLHRMRVPSGIWRSQPDRHARGLLLAARRQRALQVIAGARRRLRPRHGATGSGPSSLFSLLRARRSAPSSASCAAVALGLAAHPRHALVVTVGHQSATRRARRAGRRPGTRRSGAGAGTGSVTGQASSMRRSMLRFIQSALDRYSVSSSSGAK